MTLGDSCAPCQGRFVRCGETRTQELRSGLYRRCEMSSRMVEGIVLFGCGLISLNKRDLCIYHTNPMLGSTVMCSQGCCSYLNERSLHARKTENNLNRETGGKLVEQTGECGALLK